MAPPRTTALTRAFLLLPILVWPYLTAGIEVDICASVNTASTSRNVSIFQSNGLCHDFCLAKGAFAITQASSCWCSDYYPDEGSQVDESKCDTPCPGFPLEDCGGKGFFGYFVLNQIAPSGTVSPTSSSTSSSKAKTVTVTASVTETVQGTATTTPLSTSTASTTSTTSSSSTSITTSKMPTTTSSTSSAGSTTSSSSSSSSTSSSSPSSTVPTIQTITDSGGAVRTVTATALASHSSSKLSGGAIAGIVIGALIAVLAAAGAFFFLYWRPRQRDRNEYRSDPSIRGGGGSSGMVASTLPEMSMNGETSTSPGSVGNRNSTIQIDPRMDPFKQGLYLRNGSHESLNTLRDDHDYSRRIQPPKVLRATNPDPVES